MIFPSANTTMNGVGVVSIVSRQPVSENCGHGADIQSDNSKEIISASGR